MLVPTLADVALGMNMNRISFGLAALPMATAFATVPAQAAVTLPDITTIETRLCPVGGASALRLGLTEEEQDPALRRAFSGRAAPIAPFVESRADYTVWSGKLAAVEFNGSATDGASDQAFIVGMAHSLEASGWKKRERRIPRFISLDSPTSYEKVLATADGPRLMVLQYSANGGASLRCGDPDLLWLSEDEGLEKLATGSLRPVSPIPPAGLPVVLRTEDCARLEFRDNFVQLLNGESSPSIIGPMDDAVIQARYQGRLRTWLRWKIIASGKSDEDALWKIEENADPIDGDAAERDFNSFMGSILEIDDANKAGDPEGKCRGLLGVMLAETKRSTAEAKRLAKINAALEAEGRRLGVNLD